MVNNFKIDQDKGEGEMIEGPDGQMRSKKQHKKYMAKLEKEKKKAEHKAKAEAEKKAKQPEKVEEHEEYVFDPNDPCISQFGDVPLIDSSGDPEDRFNHKYTKLQDINEALKDQEVTVRARVHRTTGKGGA